MAAERGLGTPPLLPALGVVEAADDGVHDGSPHDAGAHEEQARRASQDRLLGQQDPGVAGEQRRGEQQDEGGADEGGEAVQPAAYDGDVTHPRQGGEPAHGQGGEGLETECAAEVEDHRGQADVPQQVLDELTFVHVRGTSWITSGDASGALPGCPQPEA
ncbi:hypothetical protein GCM10020001_110460 [Nonomuraea salmonea]